MVDARTIATPDGSAIIYGPIPPSHHGACVTRLLQPENFHGQLTFSALFLDAAVHCRGQRGGTFNFTVPRRQAFAAAMMLHLVRNELLHRLQRGVPFNFVEAAIDGMACRVDLLGNLGGDVAPEWFRVALIAGNTSLIEDLNIAGIESLDDFASGYLKYFAEGSPCSS